MNPTPDIQRPVPDDRPELLVFPPVLPAGGLVLALGLEYFWPLAHVLDDFPISVRGGVAALLLLAGLAIVLASGVGMQRAGTHVNPRRTVARLVEAWPFSWSRNPMYLGGSLGYVGFGLGFRLYWMLLLLPLVLVLLHFGVVRREEEYLQRKFGLAYLNYKARVRRWL